MNLFDCAPYIILLKCFVALKYKIPRLVKYKIAENFRFYNLLVLEGGIKNRPINLDLYIGDFNLHHISLNYIEDKKIQRLCKSYYLFGNYFQAIISKKPYLPHHREQIIKKFNELPEFLHNDISDYIYKKEKRKTYFALKRELINYNTILSFTKHCKYKNEFFESELVESKKYIDELSKKLEITVDNINYHKPNEKDKLLYNAFFGKTETRLITLDKICQLGYSDKIFDIISHQMFKKTLPNKYIQFIRACDINRNPEQLKEDPKYGEFYDEIIDLINRMKKK